MNRIAAVIIGIFLFLIVFYITQFPQQAGFLIFFTTILFFIALMATNGLNFRTLDSSEYVIDEFGHMNLYTVNDKVVHMTPDQIQIIENATRDRKTALEIAKPFLKKYKNMWGNLCLCNKHCSINLKKDGIKIQAFSLKKGESSRYFEVVSPSGGYNHLEIWNIFCMIFNEDMTYDQLVKHCSFVGIKIIKNGENQEEESFVDKEKVENEEIIRKSSLEVDINNCEEEELNKLPGISVIIAKKIIKHRKEINGFKSIEELFEYLKIKSHIQEQLKSQIVIKEIRQEKQIIHHSERNLDL